MSAVTKDYFGPFCASAGLTEQDLIENNLHSIPRLAESSRLVNGLLYELGLFRRKHNVGWSIFKGWIEHLCGDFLPYVAFNESNLRRSIERLSKKIAEMKRNKKDWKVFMELPYNVPVSKPKVIPEAAMTDVFNQSIDNHQELLTTNQELSSDLVEKLKDKESKLHTVESVLKDTKVENQTLAKKVCDEKRKRRNVCKQLKRRDTNIENQKQQISSLSDALSDEKKKSDSDEKRYKKAVLAKEKFRSKAYYYSRKKMVDAKTTNAGLYTRLSDIQGEFDEIVDELKKSLRAKDSEYEALQIENEQLLEEHTMPSKTISTFNSQTGAFNDSVRHCCMELLSLNVGVRNVEPIIRSVMRNVGGIDVERLPKYSTLVSMFSEMKVIACAHLSEELAGSQHTTLHSDGTTKFSHHYGSFQISTEKSAYTLGLMEMSSGSAKHTLDCLKDVLADINKRTNSDAGDRILADIRNTMSDRHIVEKSFNNLLEDYRLEVLPSIIENWENLSTDERTNLASLNSFFCGMHLVVGMADTAAATVKEWESVHFESPQGAASLPKVFARNEAGMHVCVSVEWSTKCCSVAIWHVLSPFIILIIIVSIIIGTIRLIRTACKAFEKHGNEQSGAHSTFLTFLQSHSDYRLKKVPLASFRGNRFNIIFLDAGILYYLKQAVHDFFDGGLSTGNQLLKAVEADSKVHEYWAVCRALGLVNKIVTGPFWRLLESDTPILEMNKKYQHMVACFEKWAQDATPVLTGEARLFEEYPPSVDFVWDALLKTSTLDSLVQEILEALFSAFSALLHRMVVDHLSGGIYDVELTEDKLRQTASVQKTNTVSERDFAQLDRLLREKPNATIMSIEAMVMFSNNKTPKWIRTLSNEYRTELFKQAREKGPKFRKTFQARRFLLLEERAKIVREKQAAAAKKKIKDRKEKEKLTQEITSLGLWQAIDQIDAGLEGLRSKTAKLKALKVQLDFRKKVLQQTHPNKKVFQSSHLGRQFTVDEMKDHLTQLLPVVLEQTRRQCNELPNDLTGKQIQHRWIVEGESEWFCGTILGKVAGQESNGMWYNIKYDSEDGCVTLNLQEDFNAGDIIVL